MREKIIFPDNILFQAKLAIRISDINYGMHLAHDKVVTLLHEARVQCLNYIGFSEVDIGGYGLIMKDLYVQYLAEAFYADEILIDIAPSDYKKKYFSFYYRLLRPSDNQLIAIAKTGMMAFDYSSRAIKYLPLAFVTRCRLDK